MGTKRKRRRRTVTAAAPPKRLRRVWIPLLVLGVCAGAVGAVRCSATTTPAPEIAAPSTESNPPLPGFENADPALVERLAAALAAKGPEYKPRTHHLHPDGSPKFTNRLILETSPYLLQHAHNPVSWYPWGDEAFARARREGKPVLVSVGYSTCHWCHVMERESFEDEEIARFLNERFICVKVDREERPDVDDIYMKAVQMLAGRGGWPMTVVLTPDREPFFGGTYFPARDGDRGARKGFLSILRELRARYDADRDGVAKQARALTERIQAASAPAPPGDVPGPGAIAQAARSLAQAFDPVWGGFGRAPKFPTPVTMELLLRYHRRTGDAQARHMVVHTLERMAAGGIFDHVGGGFHRYSVDGRWLVPHFEKMLYDNAQLAALYLEAYQATGREDFARVAAGVLDYVIREMTDPQGGFYSATDADSKTPQGHEEEGWFFTWTPDEIDAAVGAARGRVVAAYYGVTAGGNFEGRNILHTPRSLEDVARSLDVAPSWLRSEIEEAKKHLYASRAGRPPPLRDEKILTSWNGLMVSAFARGALVLDRPEYADAARRSADFVLRCMRAPDGRLLRTFKDGRANHAACLDDYAFLIQGMLDLYEATYELRWIEAAIALQEELDAAYVDRERGGYFMTGDGHDRLLAREKPRYDGAEPSGNSVAALNLLRLEELTGKEVYRKRAEAAFAAFSAQLSRGSSGQAKMLAALDYYLDSPIEVLIVRPDERADASTLLAPLRRTFLPNRILTVTAAGAQLADVARTIPLLEGKRAIGGKTTAFVCTKGRCELPTSDPEVFARQIAKARPLLP